MLNTSAKLAIKKKNLWYQRIVLISTDIKRFGFKEHNEKMGLIYDY